MNLAYLDEGAVRIRGTKGSQTIEDLVQGTVTWPQDIDDFVILRADGTPTYMLAVVVDDHDMGVTHVIRGDDHLNNAFRQLSIYRAMGWHQPTYGHIPLIMDENGKKLSKRTGAAAVEDYRDMGILPQAMVNYLARLGWGHGNHELFDMAQAVKWFDIKDVGRNPARLDMKKLRNINGHYIRSADPEELAYLVDDMLPHGVDHATLLGAVKALQERSADLNALAAGTMFLWANRPIALAEPLSAEDKGILMNVLACLTMATWTQEGLHKELNVATIACQLKLGKVVAPLRMALTGSKISPPITDTLILLGRDESLNRIRDAL
jgi:glutamyl-tRNA synthetase